MGNLNWSIWTGERIHSEHLLVCGCVCVFLHSLAFHEGGLSFLHMYRSTNSGATSVHREMLERLHC
jgi:hypothetical protein